MERRGKVYMKLDYYYKEQADQFSFIRVPKLLMTDSDFAEVSLGAKLMYGVLLDRMGLSTKNRWLDEQGRVFIIYRVSDLQEVMGVTEKTAIKLLKELETFGLVEKRRRGLGLPSLLYVKSFMNSPESLRTAETGSSEESRTVQNDSSRTVNFTVQELPKTAALNNNTELNNTNNKSNLISSIDGFDEMDEDMLLFRVRTQIDYDSLLIAYPIDQAFIDGVVDLIQEVLASKSDEIQIASSMLPMKTVKERFRKIKYPQVEYVMNCFQNYHGKIKNVKKYLLAMLFNAPATMEGYYAAEVNYDMAKMAANC